MAYRTLNGLSTQQQLLELEKRGWGITSKAKVEEALCHVGLPHLGVGNKAIKLLCNSSLDTLVYLSKIDRELRGLFHFAIGIIELSFRRNFSHYYSSKYGAFSYWHGIGLRNGKESERIIKGFKGYLASEGYGEQYENWDLSTSIELIMFDGIKKFFDCLSENDQKDIAQVYQVDVFKFRSWLGLFHKIRNKCAHHNPIWNREFESKSERRRGVTREDFRFLPPWIPDGIEESKRVYYGIVVCGFMLRLISGEEHKEYCQRIFQILRRLETYPKLMKMAGVPDNWKEHPLLIKEIE